MSGHLFPYRWTLKDAVFTKDKGTVFSTFSCGGGSTMGYKLAGFDVIGCNEIDPKMMACYVENHKPKYSFLESISTLKLRNDLPKELYELDILDGSPPCSTFSMSGQREKTWGKEKKFREGQAMQVLDTLFFDYIDLVEELQPKVAVAENVKGLLLGSAREYVRKIYKAFDLAGYECQHFLLDACKMGVPQRRERVFFVALRKDLAAKLISYDMFLTKPVIDMDFKEQDINYGEYRSDSGILKKSHGQELMLKYFKNGDLNLAHINARERNILSQFNSEIVYDNNVMNTIDSKGCKYRVCDKLHITQDDYLQAGTFPMDYKFHNVTSHYLIGMSVPPVMTAQIATRIHEQWLSKF